MNYLRKILAIVWKDIIAELRTKEMFSAMFVFAVLVIVIFNFAFELRGVERVREAAPGILWVAFTFAGVLGLNRAFVLEKDRGCLEGLLLAPVDHTAVYFGKMISTVLFMLARRGRSYCRCSPSFSASTCSTCGWCSSSCWGRWALPG